MKIALVTGGSRGIGKAVCLKQLLLKQFKSVKRIKEATLGELQEVLGKARGEKLHTSLHQTEEKS